LIGGEVPRLGFAQGGLNLSKLPFVGIHVRGNGLGGQKGFAALGDLGQLVEPVFNAVF